MRNRRYLVDLTPSWGRPQDYEWVVWPPIAVQRSREGAQATVAWTLRALFFRCTVMMHGTLTAREVARWDARDAKEQQRAEATAGTGHLNEVIVSVTPAPFDHADRRWLLWPIIVHRKAANGMVPMTRNGTRVWRDESLVFQFLVARLRIVARGELSRRTIAKHELMERLPDIGQAAQPMALETDLRSMELGERARVAERRAAERQA